MVRLSGDNLGNHAGANGTAAFADSEAQTFFHGDRSDQGNNQLDVVARHDHFHAFGQFAGTGHVSGTEVELRTVALEERGVTTTFVLAQYVDFGFELGVRLDGARLGQNLTTLNVFTLGTTQQNTNVLTGTAFVQQLAELSTPVQVVLVVSRIPTISTSSWTLMMPRSTRPVTTVPRPEMENTSSIGIRNGLSMARSGSGM